MSDGTQHESGGTHARLLPLLLLLLGCYDSFTLELGTTRDAGPDGAVTLRDAGRLPDGAPIPVDAGPDATVTLDDAGPVGVDAGVEPPLGRPPNPTSCVIEPTIFPFDNPVLEYRWPNGPVVHSDSVHVSATPLVIDLEPDGEDLEPVIVFTSYPPLGRGANPGILRIVDPRTDTTISYPPDEGGRGVLEATTNLAAGDIDGDGRNEIVGFGPRSATYAFRSDGSLLWTSGYPRFDDIGTIERSAISGGPAIADLDGDGDVEIVVGRSVLDGATGELVWDAPDTTGNGINSFFGPLPCVSDLEGDGFQEVIGGNTLFEHDGTVRWQADVPDGLCGVGDMLSDHPGPEIALVSNGTVRLLAPEDGTTLWQQRLEGRATRNVGGAPNIADFDGDGDVEMGIAHGAAYAVYDPDCEGRGDGCVGAGVRWKSNTSDASSAGTGSSVFDFNGDGRAEVIYNDEYQFRVYDGIDGTTLFQHRNSSRTRTENPTIADIDNDGDAEIIFCANAEARFIMEAWTDPGVEVWGDARGRWVGARRIWNQHAYSITNVTESGAIPRRPEPSWATHNTYRQNRREGEIEEALNVPDLWGGRGSFECLEPGVASVRIEVSNYGLENAGAGVVVSVYRGPVSEGERVAEGRTTRFLRPEGDSEVVEIIVPAPWPPENHFAVLDDPVEPEGGSVFECREGNNEVLIWQLGCR